MSNVSVQRKFLLLICEDEKQWLLESWENAPVGQHLQLSSRDVIHAQNLCHLSGIAPVYSSLPFSTSPSLLSKHLVYLLNDPTIPHNMSIRNLGSFLESVPSRLGHNQALDDAVQCICTAYGFLLPKDSSRICQGRREYYAALRSLRLSVVDEHEALSSNVLCAAVLLSWYEVSFVFISVERVIII